MDIRVVRCYKRHLPKNRVHSAAYMNAVHTDLAGLYDESARDIVLFQKTACQLVGDGRVLTFQGIVFAIRRYESEYVRDLIKNKG